MNIHNRDSQIGFFRFIVEVMFGSTNAERKFIINSIFPWLFLFGICFVAIHVTYKSQILTNNLVIIGLIVITAVFAIVALCKYISLLGQIDEYARRIITEGAALGAGLTIVIFLIYELAEFAGAPGMTSLRSITILGITIVLSQIFVAFKYQ